MSERERVEPVTGAFGAGEARASLVPPAPTSATWTSSEPWSRTLLVFVRDTVVMGTTIWTVMSLLGDEVLTPGRAAFQGALTAALAMFARRSGSLVPGAPFVIFGGVTLGAGLIAGVAARWSGASLGEAAGVAAIGVFLGGVMIWMGERGRRLRRDLERNLVTERVAPVLVTRDELQRRVAAYQQTQRPAAARFLKRLVVGIGVVLGIYAFPYARVFGAEMPEWAAMLVFFGMWGAFGLGMRATARTERLAAGQHGLVCPSCARSYFAAFGNTRLQKNLEDAGCCPQCGVRIVTEEGT